MIPCCSSPQWLQLGIWSVLCVVLLLLGSCCLCLSCGLTWLQHRQVLVLYFTNLNATREELLQRGVVVVRRQLLCEVVLLQEFACAQKRFLGCGFSMQPADVQMW